MNRNDYFSRIAERVDLDALAHSFIEIVGVGSVGSMMALELAGRCGVGHLGLVDGDRLEPHNLARHALPPAYLWANKAAGTADLLSAVPGLDVGFLDRHVDESMPDRELDRLLAPADLIVVATDDRRAQRRVSARALALDIPALVPGLYAHGGGEVFVQLGPAHPCFLCWDDFRPPEAEVRGARALSTDALAVIQQAIYLCIGVLDTRAPEARDLAPASDDRRPRQLFVIRPAANLLRVPVNRRPGCPSCAVGPSAVRAPRRRRARDHFGAPPTSARDWFFATGRPALPPSIDACAVSEEIVLEGSTVVLSWSTRNATHVLVDGRGPHPTEGELAVTVTDTTFFTIAAVNPHGRASSITRPVRVLPLPRLRAVELPPFSTLLRSDSATSTDRAATGANHLAWPLFEFPAFRRASRAPSADPAAQLLARPFPVGRPMSSRGPAIFNQINRVWSRATQGVTR